MISYAPLWRTMKQRGVSTYALISQYGFSRGTLDRLKQTRNVTTNTLDDLCRILDCEIWDVIEYIPDTKKTDCSHRNSQSFSILTLLVWEPQTSAKSILSVRLIVHKNNL